MYFYRLAPILLTIVIINILFLQKCGVQTAFPGIFPILPTEWYYKPTPKEQLVLGLLLVKILSLRLASVVGLLPLIPFHLGLGKRSVSALHPSRNLTTLQSHNTFNNSYLSHMEVNNDLSMMLKVFSGIRKMDTNDCFLKALCVLTHSITMGKGLKSDRKILDTIRYLDWFEQFQMPTRNFSAANKPSVMNVFMHSIKVGENRSKDAISCVMEYPKCFITINQILKYDSIIMPML